MSIDIPLAKRALNNGRLTRPAKKKVGLPGGPRYRNWRANQLTGSHSNPIAQSAARFFSHWYSFSLRDTSANFRAVEREDGETNRGRAQLSFRFRIRSFPRPLRNVSLTQFLYLSPCRFPPHFPLFPVCLTSCVFSSRVDGLEKIDRRREAKLCMC